MATPPPPRRSVAHTPPTPIHGSKLDHYEPYSPRRTTRSTTQRLNLENKLSVPSINFSPPLSSHGSPAATRHGEIDNLATAERNISPDGDVIMSDAASDPEETMARADALLSGHATMGMLPTPAKTPRKKVELPANAFNTTARVLFPPRSGHVEDVMPSPRKKKGRGRVEMSLDAASNGGDEEPIAIYTDSKERIPELDTSADNPFYEQPNDGGEIKDKGRKIVLNREMEKAVKRTDGAVYIFRGRKIFRKFEQDDDDEDDGERGMMGADSDQAAPDDAAPVGRLTRSSFKPRLLFPTEAQKRERELRDAMAMDEDVVDEEATTEIDEDALNEVPDVGVHSDDDDVEKDHPGDTPSKGKETGNSSTSRYYDAISGSGSSTIVPDLSSSVRITRSITKKHDQGGTANIHQVNNNNHRHQNPVTETPAARTAQNAMSTATTATTTANGTGGGRQKRKKKTSPFGEWRRVKKPRTGVATGSKVKVNDVKETRIKASKPGNNRRTRSSGMPRTTGSPTAVNTDSAIPQAARLNKK